MHPQKVAGYDALGSILVIGNHKAQGLGFTVGLRGFFQDRPRSPTPDQYPKFWIRIERILLDDLSGNLSLTEPEYLILYVNPGTFKPLPKPETLNPKPLHPPKNLYL